MLTNDDVHPAARTATRRALRGRYSPNAIPFFAECIVEHVPKEVECSQLTDESVPTPSNAAVSTPAT